MTSPIDTEVDSSEPKAESFVDWFHINSRLVSIVGGVLVVAAFGAWFVSRMTLNEVTNSDKQLLLAKQSLNTGNQPLAEADLKKVADKYSDRPAGAEAGMLLGQLRLDKGDAAGATAGLRELAGKVTDGPNASSVRGLLGDALMQGAKPAEAAAEYEKASSLSAYANEKAAWLSKAARAYGVAGNSAQARKLYEGLSTQSDNLAIAAEARVRLGELTVGAKA